MCKCVTHVNILACVGTYLDVFISAYMLLLTHIHTHTHTHTHTHKTFIVIVISFVNKEFICVYDCFIVLL